MRSIRELLALNILILAGVLGAVLVLTVEKKDIASELEGPIAEEAEPAETAEPVEEDAVEDEEEPKYEGTSLKEWIAQLGSAEAGKRQSAAYALGTMGRRAKPAVPALVKALKDDDRTVQLFAAQSLKYIGPAAKEAVPALIAAVEDKKLGSRSGAADALGSIGPGAKAAIPVLIRTLQDENKSVRESAAGALGGIGPSARAAIPHLIKALDDNDTCASAARALGDIGPASKAAVPALARKYQSKIDIFAAQSIIYALQRIGEPALPTLADAYKRGGSFGAAGQALKDLGAKAKAAVPTVVEGLESKQAPSRWEATSVLAHIGPEAKAAVPALLKAAKDKDGLVREGAAFALYRIDPEGARQAGISEPPTQYMAFINSQRTYFEEETLGFSSGGQLHGKVVLWVNGNPIKTFEGGGSMFPLDQWLRPGKNELSVSGLRVGTVYVLVAKHQAMNFQGVVGKREFPGPGAKTPDVPLVFETENLPKPPRRE